MPLVVSRDPEGSRSSRSGASFPGGSTWSAPRSAKVSWAPIPCFRSQGFSVLRRVYATLGECVVGPQSLFGSLSMRPGRAPWLLCTPCIPVGAPVMHHTVLAMGSGDTPASLGVQRELKRIGAMQGLGPGSSTATGVAFETKPSLASSAGLELVLPLHT